MTEKQAAGLVAKLQASNADRPVTPEALALTATDLAKLEWDVGREAVERVRGSTAFFPSWGEIMFHIRAIMRERELASAIPYPPRREDADGNRLYVCLNCQDTGFEYLRVRKEKDNTEHVAVGACRVCEVGRELGMRGLDNHVTKSPHQFVEVLSFEHFMA